MDTRAVVRRLRTAVTTSGLSQGAFAAAVGTSAPRLSTYLRGKIRPSAYFLVRAERLADSIGTARDRDLTSAPLAAVTLRAYLAVGDDPYGHAMRRLLQARDDLRAILGEDDPALVASWEAAPISVGVQRWDELLAAVAAHEFERVGLPAAPWMKAHPLDVPWLLTDGALIAEETGTTPEWLRERNIFTITTEYNNALESDRGNASHYLQKAMTYLPDRLNTTDPP